jgi:hypothetical protein
VPASVGGRGLPERSFLVPPLMRYVGIAYISAPGLHSSIRLRVLMLHCTRLFPKPSHPLPSLSFPSEPFPSHPNPIPIPSHPLPSLAFPSEPFPSLPNSHSHSHSHSKLKRVTGSERSDHLFSASSLLNLLSLCLFLFVLLFLAQLSEWFFERLRRISTMNSPLAAFP